jgi:hypothetical protein
MNEHAEVMTIMQQQLDAIDDAIAVMPSALAVATYRTISPEQTEDRLVQYLTVEMLKAMARKLLARRFDIDSDETEAYQGDLFSGALQKRYPIPRRQGEEPVYKLRTALTPEERAWNVEQLRKSARARLEHADALEAEGQVIDGRPASVFS